MAQTPRLRSALVALTCASLAFVCLPTAAALAQLGAFGGTGGPTLTAPAITTPDRPDAFAVPSRDESAMQVGDWLLYPSAFAGIVFDTNPNQVSTGSKSSAGFRLVPSFLAETTNGISKTTLYGMADGRIYTNQSNGNADAVAARTGFIEDYAFAPDLVFNGQGDFTRQKDLFSTFGVDHSVTTLNPTAVGLAPVANPLSYDQFSGAASVRKDFNGAFVRLSGSVIDIVYDRSSSAAPSPDGVDTTETLQGGVWINPVLYAYVEGGIDQRNYSIGSLNSNGFRTVGGLGSDQIGLFRGEVYAGYQSESYNLGALGSVNSPVYGGRIYYYPLPQLTISSSVDESLGASLLASAPGSPLGTSTRVTNALAQATYSMMTDWAASGRFGFIHTGYVDTSRVDNSWTLGTTVNYSVWENLALTFDYQHIQTSSNVAFQGFDRDVVTLGLTYKY
jgi:hypothetical protein